MHVETPRSANDRLTGLAFVEILNYTPAMVALDALEKAAGVRLIQMELNDFNGVFLKVTGDSSSLCAAVDAAKATVAEMKGTCHATVIDMPVAEARRAMISKPERSPLLNQPIVVDPAGANDDFTTQPFSNRSSAVSDTKSFAIGLIETQGFTAVMEAIDTACKAADVTILGKEKLGGGYITIVVKGDVAAVRAAVDAAKPKVEGLGKLIAAHVIPRPAKAFCRVCRKSKHEPYS
ncbi:MAG: BMC domain-containing protein [Pirellulales bacterium]